MSAEHTNWLLRELYKEEFPQQESLSEEEEADFSPAPGDLETLAQLQELLDQVRPALATGPAPPESIRQGIFEAAHREAAVLSRRASRRPEPNAPAPGRRRGSRAFAALAATAVCVLGAAYLLVMTDTLSDKFQKDNDSIAHEVTFGSGPMAQTGPWDVEQQHEAQEEARGGEDYMEGSKGGDAPQELALNDDTDSAKADPAPRLAKRAPAPSSAIDTSPSEGRRSRKSTPKPPLPSPVAKPSPSSKSADAPPYDIFDAKSSKGSEPKRNSFGGQEAPTGPAKRQAPATAQPTEKTESFSKTPMADLEERAPDDATAKAPGEVPKGLTLLQDAESAWKSENYPRTLERADQYIASGRGTATERARALELKAQALRALGRGTEATAVLKTLQEDYPSYYKKENVRKKRVEPSSKSMSDSKKTR